MNAKYNKTFGKLLTISAKKEVSFYQHKQSFAHSMLHSFNGVRHFFMHERNGKIEAAAAIATIVAAIIFNINTTEWLAILLCIGLVISAEMLNASLEQLCNKVEVNYHPTIKIVKDVAAGAVLFAALISVAMASIIFLPKLF